MNKVVYEQRDDYTNPEWLQKLTEEELDTVIRAYEQTIRIAKNENWTSEQRHGRIKEQARDFEKFYSKKYGLVM